MNLRPLILSSLAASLLFALPASASAQQRPGRQHEGAPQVQPNPREDGTPRGARRDEASSGRYSTTIEPGISVP